jgi:hypothetical protein
LGDGDSTTLGINFSITGSFSILDWLRDIPAAEAALSDLSEALHEAP